MSRLEKEIERLKSKPKDYTLHKPHPRNIIKSYKVNDILNVLEEWRLI